MLTRLVCVQHPQIVELINKLLNTPNQELSHVLAQIEFWKWPRSDLNAWVKVLDKFDAILEDVIREYDVDQLQLQEFAPETKKMVSEVLRFERLLLENSTNRKMFNSYDVSSLSPFACCISPEAYIGSCRDSDRFS